MRTVLLISIIVAVVFWVALIFYFSSQLPVTSERQASFVYNFLKKLDNTLDFTKTELYVRLRNFVEKAWFPDKHPTTGDLVRKTAHFGLYFILGIVCFFFGLVYNKKLFSAIVFGISLPTLIAVLDEYNQRFYHRGSSLDDVIIDMTGAAFGLIFSLLVYLSVLLIKKARRKKPASRFIIFGKSDSDDS